MIIKTYAIKRLTRIPSPVLPRLISALITILLAAILGLKFQSDFLWNTLIAFFMFSLAAFVLAMYLPRRDEKSMTKVLLLAYGIRVMIAFLTIGLRGGGDEIFYDQMGSVVSEAWSSGHWGKITANRTWYPELTGLIYLIFGDSFLGGRFSNCLVGMLIVWFTYKLAKQVTGEKKVAKGAALLTTWMPALIVNSGLQRKDTLITLLTIVGISIILRLSEKPSYPKAWALLCLNCFLIYLLRPVAALSIGFLAFGWIIFTSIGRRHRIFFGIFLVIIGYALWSRFVVPHFSWVPEHYIFNAQRRATFENSSVIFLLTGSKTSFSAFGVVDYLIFFLRFIFSPHPFYLLKNINLRLLIDSIDGLFWYVFIIGFVPIGFFQNWRNRRLWPLLWYTIAFLFVLFTPLLSLTQEPFRQRMPVVPLILILAALGMVEYRRARLRQRRRYKHWFFTCFLLTIGVGGTYIFGLF